MEEYYNPYNDKNTEINDENIKQLLEGFNIFYKINNIELIKRAFIHRSYVKSNLTEIKLVKIPYKCIELKQYSNFESIYFFAVDNKKFKIGKTNDIIKIMC